MSSLFALRTSLRHIRMPVRMLSRAVAPRLGLDDLPKHVRAFVEEKAAVFNPDAIHVCDGSQDEYNSLLALLEKQGTVAPLNQEKRPGCYIAWTSPDDVARAEADTYICSDSPSTSGPTNNWESASVMRARLAPLFASSMRGRTLYLIPFAMGPIASPFARCAIELTDSPYVAVSMRIMTRMGKSVLQALRNGGDFVPCVHSVGRPITPTTVKGTIEGDSALGPWPCNIKNRTIAHFPDTNEIWSFGSGYGGNSLLGKKCLALRIASVQAQREGWLAEHMLILGITNPQGEKKYIAAAFPSACGKTNLAMMQPSLPGWKVEVVGDDIAWLRPGRDGTLRAVNPEFGFFGVAPGTAPHTNPHALKTCERGAIFTNVAMTEDRDVWWEGLAPAPTRLMTWRRDWVNTAQSKGPYAQPNSRFTVPISQCPVLDGAWEDPEGVPISAIVFGGRRNDTIPLVYECRSWEHGVYVGSTLRSLATAASDQSGLVNDPMAMKAFCGYNIKDYFAHWLSMGTKGTHMPRVYHVNWFQKDSNGKFVWPGFGENARVLEWVFNRVSGRAQAVDSPIGLLPHPDSFNLSGLSLSDAQVKQLFSVKVPEWLAEAEAAREYFTHTLMSDERDEKKVPPQLLAQLNELVSRLVKK